VQERLDCFVPRNDRALDSSLRAEERGVAIS
jgi:hypothetical protein